MRGSLWARLSRPGVCGKRWGVLALVCGALANASPGLATTAGQVASLRPDALIDFKVMRDGARLGHHRITVQEAGAQKIVEVEIALDVRLAFFTLYEYRHHNREVWEDGKLLSLESTTDDNGDRYEVRARRTHDGILVDGADGRFIAPADVVPTSYWNPRTLQADALLDTQRGTLRDVRVSPMARESVRIGDRSIPARRYRIAGDLNLDIWYDDRGEWVKLAFDIFNSRIDYFRRPSGVQG